MAQKQTKLNLGFSIEKKSKKEEKSSFIVLNPEEQHFSIPMKQLIERIKPKKQQIRKKKISLNVYKFDRSYIKKNRGLEICFDIDGGLFAMPSSFNVTFHLRSITIYTKSGFYFDYNLDKINAIYLSKPCNSKNKIFIYKK